MGRRGTILIEISQKSLLPRKVLQRKNEKVTGYPSASISIGISPSSGSFFLLAILESFHVYALGGEMGFERAFLDERGMRIPSRKPTFCFFHHTGVNSNEPIKASTHVEILVDPIYHGICLLTDCHPDYVVLWPTTQLFL